VADAPIKFKITIDESFRAAQLGFLKGSNPSAYKRLMTFATVNAGRTYTKPMKAAAPRGKTGNLVRGVKVKSGRYQRPSAVVGPLLGGARKPYYRWFVTQGRSGSRTTKLGVVAVKPVAARPFVSQVAENATNEQRAIDAYYKTVEAFYNDNIFKGRILKFRRGKR
jgi:hypothetical protein